jgi:mannosidase alpha-like ER degradation enhancer 2
MGNYSEFARSVHWVTSNVNFDRDITVSVFETNIRIVGGLLAAHFLALSGPSRVENYDGKLFTLAHDLATRLLPAFDTPTGIPFGMVNLKRGVMPDESQVTSVAGAGTFLLEFGVISKLTGDSRFHDVAKRASNALYTRRSRLGLIGNHINVFDGQWTLRESGIGAGVDSYLEYLVKAYLLFGDLESYDMFLELDRAIVSHSRRGPWYYDVHMDSGAVAWPLYNSLQGFWPGLLSQIGRAEEAVDTMRAFHGVWRQFGAVPEGFNVATGGVQQGQQGYPLRPELMESAYHMHRATGDPYYWNLGRDYVTSLEFVARVDCGYASVKDVATRELEDRMESFFLSETLKYLFLLFDTENPILHRHNIGSSDSATDGEEDNGARHLRGWWVFNTEGHPLPVKMDFFSAPSSVSNADVFVANFSDISCPVPGVLDEISRCGLDVKMAAASTMGYYP